MPRQPAFRLLFAPLTTPPAVHGGADGAPQSAVSDRSTLYRVEASEKFDALCLIQLLADDPFYVEYYPAEHARWRVHG